MHKFPVPTWRPTIVPTSEWTIENLRKYLHGAHFTLFENGSCVVWPNPEKLSEDDCKERLLSVVTHHPDFKVRRHSSGDFLVTFRGGVGGVMSGEILRKNESILRAEAFTQGKLPSEMLKAQDNQNVDDIELIAGLYIRAQLYRDVESQIVVKIV
jgi:hypothetical protein